MNVQFVDLPRQIAPYLKEIQEVMDEVVFRRADFIMRDDLLRFEQQFAEYTGTRFAVGLANGSDALNLSMKVLGIGEGDEVISVSHTFVATLAAIVHAGGTPVLADVGNDHVLDATQLSKLITKKTRAIIPVHLNGRVCDMGEILSIAREHRLHVVEDSAQSIGAAYKGKKAGSFGILSTNSFYPFKTLGCFGDGGAITTDDQELAYRLRCLRDNGQDRESGEIKFWGWNSRLDNLQAAILLVMLGHVGELIERRREIAQMYWEELSSIPKLTLPLPPSKETDRFNSYQNYVLQIPRRDELVAFLRKEGVGVLISWPKPTHHHPALKLQQYSLPVTEKLSREVVSIPMHPALTDAEARHVTTTIRKFFES